MPVSLNQRSMSKPLSWNLNIDSTIVVVNGSMTIGSVMVQLVNRLDVSQDFSDYALWWPKTNIWLTNTKWTLDQYGVQSDAILHFTSMHKSIRLQLPDLRILSINADFSVSVFAAVCKLCKDLGIRHAEELSLLRLPKISNSSSTTERRTSPRRRRHNIGTLNRHNSMGDSLANNTSTLSTLFSPTTPKLRSTAAIDTIMKDSTIQHQHSISNLSKSLNSLVTNIDGNLARTPIKNHLPQLIKPINIIEKSKLNCLWYDSSRSLMEQNTNENELILLRFKYFTFYDLNPKFDAIRLNQLYEQAKWSILSEDIDCTEEEMMTFAALQLQIQIQSFQSSSASPQLPSNDDIGHEYDNGNDYDIDRALERLQDSLLGTTINNSNQIPTFPAHEELCDYLRLLKPRRFTLKTFKRYWFVMRDNQLTYYSNQSQQRHIPIEKISLKGCEILPDVNISSKKYAIRLMIPSIDGMNETLIRCSTEEQYAKWMAAFRLASKGRSIGESSYETERESILALLNMQRPSSSNHQQTKFDIQPETFVSTKFVKKYKTKQVCSGFFSSFKHGNI
jgi:kindlin 2